MMPTAPFAPEPAIDAGSATEVFDPGLSTAGVETVGPGGALAGFDRLLRAGPVWWREFEEAWLGPTHAALADRAARAGWRPDGPGSYCPRCGTSTGPHEVRERGVPARSAGGVEGCVEPLEDVAAPPGDGPGPQPVGFCTSCRDQRLPWARAVRLGAYDGLLREAIHELKFTRFRAVGWALGRLMGVAIRAAAEEAGMDPAGLVLVPVPMSSRRRLARGIDHTLTLARGVRAETGGLIVRALVRRHGPSQLEVPAGQRASNVTGVFQARRPGRLVGKTVVLIDDVRTTGATLRAAARAISRGISLDSETGTKSGGGGGIWVATAGVTAEPGG